MAQGLVLSTVEISQPLSYDLSSEKLINCFVKQRDNNQVGKLMIVGMHGFGPFGSNAGANPGRGSAANAAGTEGYLVVNNTFYTVDTGGTRTSRGTLSTTSGDVFIAPGAFYVFITDGTNGYYYKYSDHSFNTVTDPEFPSSPIGAQYVDGYFMTLGTVSGYVTICLSDLDDPSSWSTVNQDAVSVADSPKGFLVTGKNLWVFGSTGSQVYTNTGIAGNFPYTRTSFQQYGIVSITAYCTVGDVSYVIGKTANSKAQLLRVTGSLIEEVDQQDFKAILENTTTVSDARMFAFEDFGLKYIVTTFPSSNFTVVYIPQTGRVNYWQLADGNRHIWNSYMFLGNKHIITSRSSSETYQLSLTTYTEGDGTTACQRFITTPTFYEDNKWLRVAKSIVYMDSSGFGSARTIQLEVSADGGNTFRSAVTSSSIAVNQDYGQFPRLTAARRATFRLTFTAAVKFVIMNFTVYASAQGR